MSEARLAIRAYLYEQSAAYIRGDGAQDAPTIMALAADVGVNANYLTQVLSGERNFNLTLLWQLLAALRARGFAPTVADAIYWPPLRSARPVPLLDGWRPAPVEADGEARLHLTLDAYLRQMREVARSGEALSVPTTRSLAKAAGVSARTVQRLRADETYQVRSELLSSIVRSFHSMGIDVRPQQLVVEPVG